MSNVLRVIDTYLAEPAMTAAIDEALLEHVAAGASLPALHFYRRRPPAVTIGYFQSAHMDVDLTYCREHSIKVVRRMSGGGAIFTDERQLVFGLSTKGLLPETVEASYASVCTALAEALTGLGAPCTYSPVNDVLCQGRKVSGSAQVRRRGAILHHGTVLVDGDLEAMFKALKVPAVKVRDKGISDPRDRVTTLANAIGKCPEMGVVKDAVAHAFATMLGLEPVPTPLTADERKMAEGFKAERYAREAWNLKR